MGEKGCGSSVGNVVDMSLKCRCRWRWDPAHDRTHPNGGWAFGGSTCPPPSIFFLGFCIILGTIGLAFSWLTLSPFRSHYLGPFSGCQDDNEGSWAVGMYFGSDPFSLRPIEQGNFRYDEASSWPVANPVLTCASASRPSHPSNFVSDPFLYLQGTKLYVFFETKNAITMQGDIGVAESTDGGASWRHLGIALDEEWHLSYPFVFAYDGQIYMMPEGSQKGDLRLYRAIRFPLQWTLDKVLINKPLVDASLVEYKGQFWLFASNFQFFGANKNGELEIYFAESPLGPWQAHKSNPVYNGHRRLGARNGGRPFLHDGKLYRVGQDCGETYGQQIRVFHVEVLTEEKFQEVEVPFPIEEWKKGLNSWNGLRYHHLDAQKLPSGEWIALMDGDRVPSGHLFNRYLIGSVAFSLLIILVLSLGGTLGVVPCVPTLSRFCSVSKKIDLPSLWTRPHATSRFHKAFSRLNRSASAGSSRLRLSSCAASSLLFLCFIVSVGCVCVGVKCLFGGNGAEEPYAVNGQYSQFTLLTMTYDARLWNLKMYIRHYSRCASVREIVVVWNKGVPPNPLTEFDSAVPVRIRVEEENSLNNRFKPDPHIKTRAVLELDDDIMMTCDDVERGFKAWREHPERIVGFYPRLIDGSPLKYRNEKYARNRREYNMILTGAAFVDSETAFPKYWSREAEQGRALVDELFNCEDILLNFILANSTKTRTVEYIHPAWAIDTSKFSSSAISRDTAMHYSKRTNCLLRFSQLFSSLPLRRWEFGARHDGWDS
eukprot:c12685_g2_i1 orf=769-3075(+)